MKIFGVLRCFSFVHRQVHVSMGFQMTIPLETCGPNRVEDLSVLSTNPI